MTEETKQNDSEVEQSPSERKILMMKADQLGIKYSPNIGTETLRARINEVLEGSAEEETTEVPVSETRAQKRRRLAKEATKLVRVRISNMNPQKRQLKGEWITAANSFITPVRKYVPFGEESENGYHLPQIILNTIQERYFIARVPDRKRAGGFRNERLKEFAIEILPPLTQEDLDKLAAEQKASGRLDD